MYQCLVFLFGLLSGLTVFLSTIADFLQNLAMIFLVVVDISGRYRFIQSQLDWNQLYA